MKVDILSDLHLDF